MKKVLFLVYFTLITFFVFATPLAKIDSLNNILKNLPNEGSSSKADILRVKTMCTIVEENLSKKSENELIILKSALKLSEKINYKEGIVSCCMLYGKYYQTQPMLALEYLQRALAIAEVLKSYKDLVKLNEFIGYYHYKIKNIQQSLFYFTRHSELCRKFGTPEEYLLSINNIAIAYYDLKDYDKMLSYLNIINEKNKAVKSTKVESTYLINSAKVYIKKGSYEKAIENLKKSAYIKDGYGDKTSYINNEIAQIYLIKNNLKDALHHALIAYNNIPEKNLIGESAAYTTETLVTIYKKMNRPDLALPYHEKYLRIKVYEDSVKNEQLNRLMMVDYGAEKKNQELIEVSIEKEVTEKRNVILMVVLVGVAGVAIIIMYLYRVLRKQNFQIENQKSKIEDLNKNLELKVEERTQELVKLNEELQRKNNEIMEALFKGQKLERKRVASQLHDNLGSTLMSINWLLDSLNLEKLNGQESKIYESIVSMTKDAYNDVRYLSHNLLPKDFDEKGLVWSLKKMAKDITESKKINLSLEIDETLNTLSKNVAFEIYGIAMELTTNILKHSEATGATLKVFWKNDKIQLQVKDNGKGFDLEKIDKGFGINSIRDRVKSLNSASEFEIFNQNGCNIQISIPYNLELVAQ